MLVKDLEVGPTGGAYPAFLIVLGERRLFFQATSKEYGWELWKTDGTAEGTLPWLIRSCRGV